VGAEIGSARHQSPHCGRRKLGLARALVDDLPATLAALGRGDIDERRAEIIADGTRDLSHEDRASADAEITRELGYLGDLSQAQLEADIFVERLTGQTIATAVPVNVDLVVSAETLLGDDDEPADVAGCGPVPASVAREMVIASPEERTKIRRLFRFAETDRLVAMESTSRTFRGLSALLIRLRDRICRTPWCNAPIRHGDHVVPVRRGGRTTDDNAQGLCEACNQVKESPGWRHHTVSGPLDRHEVETTTPTGHTTYSRAPVPPRAPPEPTWQEITPGRWVLAA